MKKWAVLFLLLAVLLLAACGGSSKENRGAQLVGTWEINRTASERGYIHFDHTSSHFTDDLSTITFYNDGTFSTLDEDGKAELSGTYTIVYDGTAIILKDNKKGQCENPITFEVSKNSLRLIDYDGESALYSRK